jgi:hypothetical protein
MAIHQSEPTYKDGKVNPFWFSEGYAGFVQTMPWQTPQSNVHTHYYEYDPSTEESGTPVKCVVCGIGRIISPDLTLKDGAIVPKEG